MTIGERAADSKAAAILNRGRMLSDGVSFADVEQAERVARGESDADWFDFWIERSRFYESIAESALEDGHRVSAGKWMWRGALSAHYAQFMWFHDPPRREAGQRRKVELYDRAAPHLTPPGERVEIPFEDVHIPGYLRLPETRGSGPHPCVVLIGGLESTKEEGHLFENLCLRRGLATFAFDGPGQGEMFFDVKLAPDFERYASAVLDYLETRPEVDGERIGVLGRSLGGQYAPRSAACDPRFRACCAWGACFDMEGFDQMSPHTQAGFLYVTGIEDRMRAEEHLRASIDLSDVSAELRCPTYVLHGRHDAIFDMDQVEKMRDGFVNAPVRIDVEDEGDHCCHNMGDVVRPRMADWMAAQLEADR